MNYLPALVCISAAILALLFAMCLPRAIRYARWMRERIREHDERAREHRRRREVFEREWKGIERRADMQASIHRRMRGI